MTLADASGRRVAHGAGAGDGGNIGGGVALSRDVAQGMCSTSGGGSRIGIEEGERAKARNERK